MPGFDAEAKAALALRLRAGGVRNLDVLRAMEAVPRAAFVPDHAEAATRDIALPIGCGQVSSRPTLVAQCLDALACAPDSRVLEVGAGSGFVTALLSVIAGRVRSTERYRRLTEEATGRLHERGLTGTTVTWADGLARAATDERFDRIILHAAVPEAPAVLLDQLAPGGVLVYPRRSGDGQWMMRTERHAGGLLREAVVCPSGLASAAEGRSLVL